MIDMYKGRRGNTISNEGGEVFTISPLQRLERFLYLGAVNGTFYASKEAFAQDALDAVVKAIAESGRDAVDMIVDVGQNAPKHAHVLVAYAIAISDSNPDTRVYALGRFNEVVRTSTHLFNLMEYIKGRRGWGGGLRRAVANWYLSKNDYQLAYQVMKYKQRDGWTHRDVLRKAHPQAENQTQNAIFKFVTAGELHADDSDAHAFIQASLEASQSDDIGHVIDLVQTYNLPREVVPTQFLKDARMWEALAPGMGMTALFRNLRNMHKSGYLVQGSDAVKLVVDKITDEDALRKGRIHPAQVFLAKKNANHEVPRDNGYWFMESEELRLEDFPKPVLSALETSFYKSFDNLEGTDRRIMLAVDVSGSMSTLMPGLPVSSAEWAALMAMVTLRQAPFAEVYGFAREFIDLGITPEDSMDDVMRKTSMHNFGWTDCAQPMVHAREKKMKFDAFMIYTDSGTGHAHNVPQELAKYRKTSGIHDAKFGVVATVANDISIGDPNDPNVLNVVGFSAETPAVLERFVNG